MGESCDHSWTGGMVDGLCGVLHDVVTPIARRRAVAGRRMEGGDPAHLIHGETHASNSRRGREVVATTM